MLQIFDKVVQMSRHLVDCPNAGSSCPFSEFGCQYKGDRETLQAHIREEPIRHLALLCDGVLDLKILLANMELSLETMVHNMELLQRKTTTIEKLYGAQIIWRIDNVKQKQNEARSGTRTTVFSPPFATARYGYKMVVSISLYGDGQVRGEYMSAFVSIMRGEYDALLEWPFTHKVVITLMDQNPDLDARNDIEYVIQPTPIAAHKPFLDRPIGERNASFGAVRFCELSIVERYIRDDVMFLKVNVDNSKSLRDVI
uniref:TNF receptor-associated factor 1 n=1 Tax=Ascaris suum TaxID=6253 RepID=F1L6A6_ASCSU